MPIVTGPLLSLPEEPEPPPVPQAVAASSTAAPVATALRPVTDPAFRARFQRPFSCAIEAPVAPAVAIVCDAWASSCVVVLTGVKGPPADRRRMTPRS